MIINNRTLFDADAAAGFSPEFHNLTGLAEAVFNDNVLAAIINCRTDEPDDLDMQTWGIDAGEWADAQARAIEHAMFIFSADAE